MGILTPTSPIGGGNQADANTQDISNIINELNGLQSNLSNPIKLDVYTDGSYPRYLIGYQQDGWGSNVNVGVKASKPGFDVTTTNAAGLTYEDNFETKTYYDSNGNIIMQEGLLSDGTYGKEYFNGGKIVSKNNGATEYIYDLSTGKNIIQIGLLPDGTYGFAVAKAGYNVSDGIT